MSFDVGAGVRQVVLNDGAVCIVPANESLEKSTGVLAVPISFEVRELRCSF
jgi:hypothetical protein